MDFAIPEELTALRASFAAFLDREVRPVEDELAPRFWRGEHGFPEHRDAQRQVKRRSCAAGFYAAHLPEDVGGMGLSALGMTLLVEDAARSGMRLAGYALAPPNPEGPTPLLLGLPDHLRDAYLKPLVTGEATMCFALTEPEAGSDAQAIRTRAERDGAAGGAGGAGGDWVINGTKHYITNGDRADFAVVMAVTDPGLPARRRAAGGITAFVVPREQYRVSKLQHTIGDTTTAELVFEDARVPADHVVGEVGQGFRAAMGFLNAGRAYIGAQALGMAEWCLDRTVEHVRVREAFGRPLAAFQGVSFPLAESRVEIEAMRWLTYHLAWRVDRAAEGGDVDGGDGAAGSGGSVVLDSSIVKYFNTDRAYRVADRCLQAFGGQGLLKEGPIEAALRNLRVLRVVEGASEVQKMVIARAMGL